MKKFIPILLIAALTACSTTKHTSATKNAILTPANPSADGSSFDKAIVIQETNETTGVTAEYAWIRSNYPGSKTGSQALMMHNNKPFDVLTITTADGNEKKVYFDISNFFGKM